MTWTKVGNIQGPQTLPVVQNGDPSSPVKGQIWIREDTSIAGLAMGMMGMTYANASAVFADTLSIKLTNRIARIVL